MANDVAVRFGSWACLILNAVGLEPHSCFDTEARETIGLVSLGLLSVLVIMGALNRFGTRDDFGKL